MAGTPTAVHRGTSLFRLSPAAHRLKRYLEAQQLRTVTRGLLLLSPDSKCRLHMNLLSKSIIMAWLGGVRDECRYPLQSNDQRCI